MCFKLINLNVRTIVTLSMEFCKDDECGGLLVSEKVDGEAVMKCRDCGTVHDVDGSYRVTETKEEDPMDRLNVNEGDNEETEHPTTEKECPACGNMECEFWMKQTRASDEPATRFYRCTDCGNVHKEYD